MQTFSVICYKHLSEKHNQYMHKQIYDTPVNMYVYSTYMPKYAMTFGP